MSKSVYGTCVCYRLLHRKSHPSIEGPTVEDHSLQGSATHHCIPIGFSAGKGYLHAGSLSSSLILNPPDIRVTIEE